MIDFNKLINDLNTLKQQDEDKWRREALKFIETELENKIKFCFDLGVTLLFLFRSKVSVVSELVGYNKIFVEELNKVGLGHRLVVADTYLGCDFGIDLTPRS